VYAVGSDHLQRDPCRGLLELAEEGSVRVITAHEVVQEFAHVRSRWSSRSESAALARTFATALGPLVRPEADDLLDGLQLFEATVELGDFDAVLGATARRRGLALGSAARGFGRVEGLVQLDPTSPTFTTTFYSSADWSPPSRPRDQGSATNLSRCAHGSPPVALPLPSVPECSSWRRWCSPGRRGPTT